MNIENIRQQAQDENTSPEILAELANSEDKLTRQYVASNPNISQETLFNLGVEFPKELLENPIFDLLLLENPNLISEIPIKTLRSLIKQDNVPKSFIIECAEKESDQDLLLGMTMNPKISRSILEKLIQSKYSEVVDGAKLHINWSEQANYNKQEAICDCFYNRIKNLKGEHDFLQDLSKLGLITSFVFQAFLNAYQVAIEKNSYRRGSHWLYDKNEYSIILGNIASSIFTPNNILEQLVNVSDFRRQVSANLNVPQYLIKQLSQDEDREVQIAIAMNPNTSEEILLSMIEYDCSYIREAIASNKNASKKVIKQLLITNKEKESEEKIYSLILANNITPPQKLVDKAINNQDLLCSLISNKNLDLKILDNISNLTKDKIELPSWRLASNSNTSVDTLVKLSENSDFYTRDYIRSKL